MHHSCCWLALSVLLFADVTRADEPSPPMVTPPTATPATPMAVTPPTETPPTATAPVAAVTSLPAKPTPKHTGPCKPAKPALGAMTNAVISSACNAKPPAVYDDDLIAIAPGGSVKLSFRTPRRDHDALLEETCKNTSKKDVVVRIHGLDAPWLDSTMCTFDPRESECGEILKCNAVETELPSSRMLTGKAEDDTTNPVAGITPYAFFGGILTTAIVAGWTGACFYFKSIEKDPEALDNYNQDCDLLAATTGVSALITVVVLPLTDWSLINAPPGGETGEKPDAKDETDKSDDKPAAAAGADEKAGGA